jgi:hypothetical protein
MRAGKWGVWSMWQMYQTTIHHNSEVNTIHSQCCGNRKPASVHTLFDLNKKRFLKEKKLCLTVLYLRVAMADCMHFKRMQE